MTTIQRYHPSIRCSVSFRLSADDYNALASAGTDILRMDLQDPVLEDGYRYPGYEHGLEIETQQDRLEGDEIIEIYNRFRKYIPEGDGDIYIITDHQEGAFTIDGEDVIPIAQIFCYMRFESEKLMSEVQPPVVKRMEAISVNGAMSDDKFELGADWDSSHLAELVKLIRVVREELSPKKIVVSCVTI